MDQPAPVLVFGDVWKTALNTAKDNWMPVLGVFTAGVVVVFGATVVLSIVQAILQLGLTGVLVLVAKVLPSALVEAVGGVAMVGMVLVNVVTLPFLYLVYGYVFVGVGRCILDLVRGQEIDPQRLLSSPWVALHAALSMFLVWLGVLLGTALLVIPGIWFGLASLFWWLVMADQGLGPIESIKESMRLTEGEKLFIFSYVLSIGLAAVLGIFACCVGYPIAVAVGWIGMVGIYDRLVQQKGTAAGG